MQYLTQEISVTYDIACEQQFMKSFTIHYLHFKCVYEDQAGYISRTVGHNRTAATIRWSLRGNNSVLLDYWQGMLPVASGPATTHFYLEIKIYILIITVTLSSQIQLSIWFPCLKFN